MAGDPAQESTVPPAAEEATPSSSEPPPPDIALWRGSDPAANVRAAIEALGGMDAFVSRGDRVAIKPNLLTAREPQYAATTNPDVVGALVLLAYEAGADDVVVFDNPTAPPRNAYDVTGTAQAVQRAGGRMKVLADRDFEQVEIPDGEALTSWPLVTEVFDADVFINVPIAKTHGLAGLTMAMKNLMGVMGGSRGLIHQSFDQKIVDVNTLVKPHLVVLDAYRMLVANGPTGGSLSDVREAKTIVAGTNQASVDAVGTTLFGRTPSEYGWLRLASERGIGEIDVDKIMVAEGTA
jgi:uncharacterized protein (DUF362 family)